MFLYKHKYMYTLKSCSTGAIVDFWLGGLRVAPRVSSLRRPHSTCIRVFYFFVIHSKKSSFFSFFLFALYFTRTSKKKIVFIFTCTQ